MRTVWAAWAWPIMTSVAIAAFILVLFRAGPYLSAADTPKTPAPDLAAAQHINTRAWRSIAKDPASHADARIVLWGQVTHFDATTGESTFRANVDAARHAPQNGVVDYPTSVIMHGDPDMLHNLVQGYIFKAEATVDGATTNSTVLDGKITVPTLTVTKLTITDKTVG